MVRNKKDTNRLVPILNDALRLEYGIIIHVPKFVERLEDENTRQLAQQLGTDSVRHADKVAAIITEMGGNPDWSFEPAPEDDELKSIFLVQLEKEQFAARAYRECAELTGDKDLKKTFLQLVTEEEKHENMCAEILNRLK